MIELALAPSVEDLITTENRKAEKRVNRVRALLLGTVLVVLMPLVFFSSGGNPPPAFVGDVGTLSFGLLGCVVIAALLRAGCYDVPLPYVSALLDYGILAFILLNHAVNLTVTVEGVSLATYDKVLFFAYLLNGYAAFRFDRKAALFSGLLSLGVTVEAIALDFGRGHPVAPVIIGMLLLLALGSAGVAQLIIAKSRRLIYQAAEHQREKDRVQTVLSRYVSPQIAQAVLQEGQLPAAGQRMRVTVLFADIRGFTPMSERMVPEEVVRFLNAYLSRMVQAIFAHGGTLDEYMGDGIMAFFGAPVASPDHAQQAVRAALAMREALEAFNDERVLRGEPPIAIGVGLHSGDCIVGNIGTPLRLDYTAIGDVVNTASRLEGLTKQYEADILMSQETYREVEGWLEARLIEGIAVRGKLSRLDVYAVEQVRAAAPEASKAGTL